jgi:hypothetical protein
VRPIRERPESTTNKQALVIIAPWGRLEEVGNPFPPLLFQRGVQARLPQPHALWKFQGAPTHLLLGPVTAIRVYLLELHMLCDCVTRGCGDHSPLTTAAILEWRRRSAWGGAAAARRGRRGVPSSAWFFEKTGQRRLLLELGEGRKRERRVVLTFCINSTRA